MRAGWDTIRLGDVAAVSNERVDPRRLPAEQPLIHYSIPALDATGGPETTTASTIQSAKFKVETDAVLISMLNPRIPRSVFARGTAETVCSTEFVVLRPTTPRLELTYLELVATWQDFNHHLARSAKGTTGSRRRSKAADVLRYSLPIPSVLEQRRIVDLIGSLDEAIEAADAVGREARSALEQIGNEASVRASSGDWRMLTLAEALGGEGVIQTGPFGSQLHQSDYVDVGTPVVMPANMRDRKVVREGMSHIGPDEVRRLARHQLREGDIAWSRRGDVTRFAVIGPDEAGMICGTGCLLVRAADPELVPWLSVWLGTKAIGTWLVENAVGATMANLNTGILSNVPVALPPQTEMPAFVGAVDALGSTITESEAYVDSLRNLRSNLLTALLSGEHEIPESYDDLFELGAAA